MAVIRILLCDDHELVRLGIRSVLETNDDIEVVGEAGDGPSAVAAVAKLEPEVVVMDIRMPGASGIEACREIRSRFPDTRVLMLTSFADDEALFSSIMAGASGYVLKQIHGSDLVDAVRTVAGGGSLLDPAVTERVLARLRGEVVTDGDVINDLTPQERKILVLVADGLTNRQIAAEVFLAEKTVKNYVSNILMKLGVSRRSEVAAFMAKRDRAQGANWP
jgi:DNA-binding NarL/FixJ family response regulator